MLLTEKQRDTEKLSFKEQILRDLERVKEQDRREREVEIPNVKTSSTPASSSTPSNFEPETSKALGFGFRCGFLGLLHLEIISERIDREYGLGIITTAPSVIYEVHKKNGEVLNIYNPTDLPEVVEIEKILEPIMNVEIFVPKEYIGNVMEVCQARRRNISRYEIY